MSTTTKSLTIKSGAIAASILTGVLALSTLTAEPAHATYNVGVKSLHFATTTDGCDENRALPCTSGAGVGFANVLEVHQTKVNGYYRFNRLEGNSQVDGKVWLAAEIGAECKRAHHLTALSIDGAFERPEGDGLAEWGGGALGGVDPFVFPRGISFPDARTMPVKKIAINVDVDYLFNTGMAGAASPEHVFDVGEDEIDARIAGGMSAAEARGTAFETELSVTVFADVRCRYNGVIQAEYYKRRSIVIPLTVRYVPVNDVAPPASGRRPPGDGTLTDAARVTNVALSVVSDPDDSCTLHLSGTIQTNGPTEVQYRFIDPHGQPSNTYSLDVDQTLTAFFSKSVQIPHAPNHDISGNLTTADDDPQIGGLASEARPSVDRYSGTYMLEVLSPNPDSAADGFNVPFCGATVEAIPHSQISVGVIYRF